MVNHFFSPLFTDNHLSHISQDPFNFSHLSTLDAKSFEKISEEYIMASKTFLTGIKYDDCTEAAKCSLIMLRLIRINVMFMIDSPLLVNSFVFLSKVLQSLQTVYKNDMFENIPGIVIAYKINNEMCNILQLKQSSQNEQLDLAKSFIVDTLSRTPIINTNLALWCHCALKHFGFHVKKEIAIALKAMRIYDSILGNGLSELLKSNRETVEKKIKVFNDIGLFSFTERILEFYSCKTSNEKRRFLLCMEKLVSDIDITESVNLFLLNNCST